MGIVIPAAIGLGLLLLAGGKKTATPDAPTKVIQGKSGESWFSRVISRKGETVTVEISIAMVQNPEGAFEVPVLRYTQAGDDKETRRAVSTPNSPVKLTEENKRRLSDFIVKSREDFLP